MSDIRLAAEVVAEVKKAVVGKDDILVKALLAVLARGHILLEDIPGVGKTTMALAFSRALGLAYHRVQFTPDVMPSDITGFSLYNKAAGRMEYQPGAVLCNLFLADELNRATSRTQSALLEAMEEYQVTVDGHTYPLPKPFVVLATQNPVGSAGTQLLPSSQLDRFMIRTTMGYPDRQSQVDILRERHHENPLDRLQGVVTCEELLELIESAKQVHIADAVYDYIVDLVDATRSSELVELGVSPRGALALCRMAKAHAFVRGGDFVTPEDVYQVFDDVCAHRLVLSAKARLGKITAREITEQLRQQVTVPQVAQL